jgi:hypothetical protein
MWKEVVKVLDPNVVIVFLAGISTGQIISLLLVTGSIKVGEVKTLQNLVKDLAETKKQKRRTPPK